MFQHNLTICKNLHEDHQNTLRFLEKLEGTLGRFGPKDIPAADDAEMKGLLGELIRTMDAEITAHFAFEEENLFPRFAEAYDPGIPTMLKSEHDIIRPIAVELTRLAGEAKDGGFDAASWGTFRDLGLELVEREVFHVQKEEMGFLPAIDQLLEPEDDAELSMKYAEIRK